MNKRNYLLVAAAALIICISAIAQNEQDRGPRRRWADQPHAAGTITAIRPDTIDVQSPDSKTVTVKLTPETRFRKDRAPAQLSDFKVGDNIFAVGQQEKDGSIIARMVASTGAEAGPSGRMMGGVVSREDLGKKFIMGEVQKIEEAKLTILRPDGVQQVIEADENTSFTNAKGESITLPDIKAGDRVGGPGELKDGTFVPQRLRVLPPRPAAVRGQNPRPSAPAEQN